MARFALVAAVALMALVASAQAGDWINARATFFGTDGWSIHKGSCGFGYLDENVQTGWDVAAITDVAPDYKGSCGKCKEVKCDARSFTDGYGAWLDRKSVCYNTEASVVVMIVDTCQCTYGANAFSNKRWCCGDMYHLDLSHWAMEKLAPMQWGVIATKVRDVGCNHQPRIRARRPDGGKTPMPDWYKAPGGWSKNMDKRLNLHGGFRDHQGRK